MFCKKCGTQIPESSGVCPKCGTGAVTPVNVRDVKADPSNQETVAFTPVAAPEKAAPTYSASAQPSYNPCIPSARHI